MPYWVSPYFRDQIVGPKPIMYCPTLTPNFFAGTRWPISCRPIDSASPIEDDHDAQHVEQDGFHDGQAT